MSALKKYIPFFTSTLLMYVVLVIIYPHYQFYIDPDGTAYLTVSKRYAAGDITKAINGYWSPWSCWLTALLVRIANIDVRPASWLINILGATGFLFISQSLFLRFNISSKLQWLFNVTLALFLCYAVFWQSFDDLWECFFLLSALRVMLVSRFVERPALWVLYGVIGCLAYFAKAYSFPFFILNTLCCGYLITNGDRKKWLLVSGVSIAVMLLCASPWIILLHNKYHVWTTATAGSLNVSWYLVGHPVYRDSIRILIPPAYPDSPTFWEDPWLANGATPHFWDSFSLFGNFIIRTGYHGLLFLLSSLQLSAFLPFIVIVTVLMLSLKKRVPAYPTDLKPVILSFILFPIGYLFINFESRYIWYMLPLSMILGVAIIQNEVIRIRISQKLLAVLFSLSYLVFPAWGFIKMYDRGQKEHQIAESMNAGGIRGSYTGNVHSRSLSRIAYFSGNQYYYIIGSGGRYSSIGLFEEMQRYGIRYYVHCNIDGAPIGSDLSILFNDDEMLKMHQSQLKEIKLNDIPDVRIYELTSN